MFTLFDFAKLTVLWILLAFAAIGGIAYLIYRLVPGLRPERKDLDEKQIAKEELDRFLVPMDDENTEIKPEVDEEEQESVVEDKKEEKNDK